MSCPLGDGRKGAELALTEVALTLWMASFAKNIRLNAALRRARDELAQTAVLAERDRIARDLHDILGHSLTAITVKAALARQLLGRDPDQVRVEITDIERLARSALADVRAGWAPTGSRCWTTVTAPTQIGCASATGTG